MQNADILIVEDDVSLLEVTRDFLEDNGLSVATCSSGSSALELLRTAEFKLVILDINLPDLIGFDVCSIIRRKSKVPIIFLSARISDTDKVTGLDRGADDYISKPYSLNELLSRIRAQMRRKYDYDYSGDTSIQGSSTGKKDGGEGCYRFGDVEVDFSARKVLVAGVEKEFPAKEFELLAYFIKNRNKSIAKETIYNDIWGLDSLGEMSTLSVHVRRLREKIEKDPSNPQFIKTIWSVGFRFEG